MLGTYILPRLYPKESICTGRGVAVVVLLLLLLLLLADYTTTQDFNMISCHVHVTRHANHQQAYPDMLEVGNFASGTKRFPASV